MQRKIMGPPRLQKRLIALAVFALAAKARAQNPPVPETSDTVIRSSAHEVLLDVVVRRKNMSLATKLKASDFTVTEDGVPQTIKTFRLVGGRDARVIPQNPKVTGPAIKSAADQANSLREPNFISIVFDSISPDSRKNALEAATDFLNQEFQPNTYAAIFGLNLRLSAAQGFTNDRMALMRAVNKVIRGNFWNLPPRPPAF